MEKAQNIISLVMKAVAVGMAVITAVMGYLPEAAEIETQLGLLSLGLFALAITALQKEGSRKGEKKS